MKIKFIVPSKLPQDVFFEQSALAKSLKPYLSNNVELYYYPNGNPSLPLVFNHGIENLKSSNDDVYIFCHDDIYILDFYWMDQIVNGLNKYDIVGLAGNTVRLPKQPSWLFNDSTLTNYNSHTLSGIVAHGSTLPPQSLSVFGAPDQQVELLDGLFLAMKYKTIIDNGLKFDQQFDYDFYDLDFCRLARSKNLKLGTIPLSVMHESSGNYNTQRWKDNYARYLSKWIS
ncbi:glycosyltransferase [Rhodoferax sp.]|uniref:glycosyltransferase n=1 Tax=Rhodoferax sp. TaxID=50421 RepID=UPI002624546E|nr:glycosyltransferase [Rhodoferax sp.]MDD5478640.1 glycosyltransferase [Rhodoferax sp.]